MKLLIIEDEISLLKSITDYFEQENFLCEGAVTFQEGVIWVDVIAGFNMGEKQEIFGGLSAGDTIVLKPTEELKSGTPVKPKL